MESNQTQNNISSANESESQGVVRNSRERMMWTLSGSIIVFALIIGGSIIFAANNIIAPRIGNTIASSGTQLPIPENTPPLSGPIKISLDNDAVMGNIDAPVTIIEFADFECPFCKKSFEELFPQLKRDYIDTGKVKFVYRDFPLDFHENARKEAEAAECARDQGGDASYYRYHDQIYIQTKSNGTGLALTQLPVIAKTLGLNTLQFQQCLDSSKYADEVEKDYQDGMSAGITGTPGWFIGKSNNDNTITAPAVEGAQPYAVFKTLIEEQLK